MQAHERIGAALTACVAMLVFRWLHLGELQQNSVLFHHPMVDSLEFLDEAKGEAPFFLYYAHNFPHIPLAVPDIPTGLQTGLIEAVPTTPLAALGLQWFRSTPYMLDYGVVPYLGATIMTERAWKKLSDDEREAVLEAGRGAEEFLFREVPRLEVSAIDLTATVRPILPDQELRLSTRYWEGAVDVDAERDGTRVTGRGYVELVGYGESAATDESRP